MVSAEQQRLIIEKIRPFHPKRIAIFGSYSRGEQTAQSDLDILVDFDIKINLFDLIGLEQELSEMLGIKVDLVTERSLNPRLKEYILKEIKPIL